MITVEYHHLFADEILKRGYPSANLAAIQNLEVSQAEISAEVLGSKPYIIHVELLSGKINKLTCTCPYPEPCKHLAAVFLYLDEKALATRMKKKP